MDGFASVNEMAVIHSAEPKIRLNTMAMAKFGRLDALGEWVAHDYGSIFFRQPCGETERLVIGPSGSQIKLLDELSLKFSSAKYYLLYVLLVSHAGRAPGRYQSPLIESHEDLQLFIWTYQKFLENDGRHHLWIGSPNSNDMLVYDQHNVIFAYGSLNAFESVLTSNQFRQQEFWFPSPHRHGYDPANARAEDELMAYFDWRYCELQCGDEWD